LNEGWIAPYSYPVRWKLTVKYRTFGEHLAKYTLNIAVILESFDKNDFTVAEQLKEDEAMYAEFLKNIGWLIPQWFFGVSGDQDHKKQVVKFNTLCNEYWSKLSKHPELQAKLLASAGLGKTIRHKFFRPVVHRKNYELEVLLRLVYPDISEEQVRLWVRKNDEAALKQLANECGLQEKEYEPYLKSYQKIKEAQ
jgi:hypothetical protein